MTGFIFMCIGIFSFGAAVVMAVIECAPAGSGGLGGVAEALDNDD